MGEGDWWVEGRVGEGVLRGKEMAYLLGSVILEFAVKIPLCYYYCHWTFGLDGVVYSHLFFMVVVFFFLTMLGWSSENRGTVLCLFQMRMTSTMFVVHIEM